jgi:hypothetical protein
MCEYKTLYKIPCALVRLCERSASHLFLSCFSVLASHGTIVRRLGVCARTRRKTFARPGKTRAPVRVTVHPNPSELLRTHRPIGRTGKSQAT